VDLQQGFVLTRHWRDTRGTEVSSGWPPTRAAPHAPAVQTSVAFIPEAHRKPLDWLLKGERDVELRAACAISSTARCWASTAAAPSTDGPGKTSARRRRRCLRRRRAPAERYLMERFITAPVWFGGTPDATACCSTPR
jgi:DNA polymerase-2